MNFVAYQVTFKFLIFHNVVNYDSLLNDQVKIHFHMLIEY